MHIIKWKKPVQKGCKQYDSNNTAFWKRWNCKSVKNKISGFQGLKGKGEKNEQEEHKGGI